MTCIWPDCGDPEAPWQLLWWGYGGRYEKVQGMLCVGHVIRCYHAHINTMYGAYKPLKF